MNEQMRRFLAQNGAKLPPREGKTESNRRSEGRKPLRRTPIQRGRGPAQESVKQKILNAKWAGIREATIYWLNKLDPDGARCFECGRKARRLELDHVHSRGRGGEYSVSNAQLLCAGPGSCHAAKHGEPQWTKGQMP